MQKIDTEYWLGETLLIGKYWQLTLCMAVLLSAFAMSSAGLLLPQFVLYYGITADVAQWLVTGYLTGVVSSLLLVDFIARFVGQKRCFLIAAGVFAIASASMIFGVSFFMVVVARFIQGSCAAVLLTLSLSMARQLSGSDKLGKNVALVASMSALGTASGPLLSGLVLSFTSWQWLYVMFIPVALAIFILARNQLPSDQSGPAHHVSSVTVWRIVLMMLCICFCLLTMILPDTLSYLWVLAILAAAMLLVEKYCPEPLVQWQFLVKGTLWVGYVSNLGVSMVMMLPIMIGSFYLLHALDLSAMQAGLVMASSSLSVALLSRLSGRLCDRFDSNKVVLLGLLVLFFGTFLFRHVSLSDGVLVYLALSLICSAGYALFVTANNVSTLKQVDKVATTSVSGFLNFSRQLGFVLGASFASTVLADYIRIDHAADPQAILAALRHTYSLAALTLLLLFIVSTFSFYRKFRG